MFFINWFWLIIRFWFFLPQLLRPFLKYSPANQQEVNAGLVVDVAPVPHGVIERRKALAEGYIPTAGKDRQPPLIDAYGFEISNTNVYGIAGSNPARGQRDHEAEPVFAGLYLK